jgi:hypothetical protein
MSLGEFETMRSTSEVAVFIDRQRDRTGEAPAHIVSNRSRGQMHRRRQGRAADAVIVQNSRLFSLPRRASYRVVGGVGDM